MKTIKNILIGLKLPPEIIETMFQNEPAINTLSLDDVEQIVQTLVEYDFSESEIGMLILHNPLILFYDPSDLEQKLADLTDTIGAKQKLLKNPGLI